MARALVAPRRRGVARRARRRGDGHRRRDVPGDPHEPGLPEPVGAAVARRRRGAARDRRRRRGSCASARPSRTASSSATSGSATAGPSSRGRSASWPVPRVRNQATVGGVLADADYASDPPAVAPGAGRPGRAPLAGRRAGRGHRRADPRLLRDLHPARRAPRRGSCSSPLRAGGLPEVPFALVGGSPVRRRRGRRARRGATRRHRRRRRAPAGVRRRVRRSSRDARSIARSRARWRRPTPSASRRSTTPEARPRTGAG